MAEIREKRTHDPKKAKAQQEALKAMVDEHEGEYGPIDVLAQDLETKLIDWASRRQPAEDRWIADAEQYAGINDPLTAMRLAKQPGVSSLFVNCLLYTSPSPRD